MAEPDWFWPPRRLGVAGANGASWLPWGGAPGGESARMGWPLSSHLLLFRQGLTKTEVLRPDRNEIGHAGGSEGGGVATTRSKFHWSSSSSKLGKYERPTEDQGDGQL